MNSRPPAAKGAASPLLRGTNKELVEAAAATIFAEGQEMRVRFVRCALLFAILRLVSSAAWAQSAQVTGRITDSSHAVIQGASVTVTNVDKGQDRQTHSNEEGYYAVPLLEPGTYRLTAQMPGFKPLARSGITLRVNQVIRIDLELAVAKSLKRSTWSLLLSPWMRKMPRWVR